jgi:hypothetical protein
MLPETRHVDDPHPVERAGCARVEGFLGDAHRRLGYGF